MSQVRFLESPLTFKINIMENLLKDESKKCTIDNLHPNWENQELHPDMIIEDDE